jgi:hypothetical protein
MLASRSVSDVDIMENVASYRRTPRDFHRTRSLLIPLCVSTRVFVGASILLVGGCGGAGKLGSFDSPDTSGSKLAEIFGLARKDGVPNDETRGRRVFCPEIRIHEGTEVARFHAGSPPSNSNLRVQYSIEDIARECSVRDDMLVLKIGVEGKVLLGPAGTPGNFTVPVRVAVVRRGDQSPVVSKLYHAAVTIAAKHTEESFTIISEPITAPFVHEHSEGDYSIKVGIDSASGSEQASSESRRR